MSACSRTRYATAGWSGVALKAWGMFHLWVSRQVGALGIQILWRLRHNTARPNVLTTDQPQPVEALLVGEVDAVHRLVHVCPQASVASVARMREAKFGVCHPDYNPACR